MQCSLKKITVFVLPAGFPHRGYSWSLDKHPCSKINHPDNDSETNKHNCIMGYSIKIICQKRN